MASAQMNYVESLGQIPKNAAVYVYGYGMVGRHLLDGLRSERPDVTVLAIVDKQARGSDRGVPIVPLDHLRAATVPFDMVLITPLSWVDDIVRDLGFLDPAKVTINLIGDCNFHSAYEADVFERYGRAAEEIEAMLEPGSAKQWKTLVDAMRRRNLRDVFTNYRSRFGSRPVGTGHYVDRVRPPVGGVVVEGGVFDGETTVSFAKLVGPRGRVYAFDPLGDRYATQQLRTVDETHGAIEIVPAALWSPPATLSFSDAGAGTIVSESPAVGDTVDAVSIDEFLARRNVPRFDFFKLDVEGAELQAIKGAINAIRTHRPICALSIYHGMRQYFEVPLFFRDHFEGYRYEIDYYSPDGLETVLYCTPQN